MGRQTDEMGGILPCLVRKYGKIRGGNGGFYVGSAGFMYDSCMIFDPTYILKLRINTGALSILCRYV